MPDSHEHFADGTNPIGAEHTRPDTELPRTAMSDQFGFWRGVMAKVLPTPPATPHGVTPETALVDNFEDLVDGLSLQELMVPVPEKTIVYPERFALTPVVTTVKSVPSLTNVGTAVELRPGITCTYIWKRPWLDTRQAIGLTYQGGVIAVAGAGIDEKDRLLIKQIQDVTSVSKSNGRQYYKTGLHNGFYWRDTLVRAWEEVAKDIGAHAVIIQSRRNNKWVNIRRHGKYAYDDVARRMHYKHQLIQRDWIKYPASDRSVRHT